MKKVISFVLCIALALSVTPVAFGANVSADEARNALKTLGLLYGTEQGFEEERSVTRSEATVMMLRLLGEEHAAEGYKGSCPFTDCAWAEKYIGYAWSKGYAYGVSDTLFGSAAPVGVRDYLTMMLRVLGYSDTKGDFSWSGSIVFSDSIGLTRGEYRAGDEFTRRDMALVSYTALTMKIKDSDMTLAERLYTQGAVSAAALKATRLAGAVNAGKREYTAAEIYERSASAVFFARMYDGPEAYKKDKPSGTASGFFITADGVAVMSYHQLDGMSRAFAQTSDGRSYEISRIIS